MKPDAWGIAEVISVVVPDAASAKGLVQRLARVFDPASISLDADRSEVRVEERRTPSQAIADTLGLIQDWLEQTEIGSVVVRLDENSYMLERPVRIAANEPDLDRLQRPNLAKVFMITGLHRVFAIRSSLDEARAASDSRLDADSSTGAVSSWRDRHARNQALFREVNEQIERLNDGLITDGKDRIVCECGNPECMQLIELTRAEYEHVREHASRFLVAPNHENPETESTVEQNERFAVVQSHTRPPSGSAGEIDPPPGPHLRGRHRSSAIRTTGSR